MLTFLKRQDIPMSSIKTELSRLESVVKDNGFSIRYERGSFISGHCIVNDKKIIIINKFFKPKARVETITQIIKMLGFSDSTDAIDLHDASELMSVV